jgi:multiple sugar transport system substrate-binding protein
MKRSVCLCLFAAFVLGAGWTNGIQDAGTGSAPAGKTVINYWTEDRHDLAYVEKKIDEFNKTNKDNIQIVLNTITDNYANMLAMSYSSGTAPDIAKVSSGTTGFDLKTFVDAKIVDPLTNYIKDPEFEETTEASRHIYEGVNAINGIPYWIPTSVRSGTRMIYNKSLLDAAGCKKLPATIQDLVNLADAITKKGNGVYYGIAATSSAPFVRWFEGSCEKSGIHPYDYNNGRFDFNGYLEPVKIANKLFKNGSVFPGSTSQGVDAMRAQFTEGTFGIWANASQEAGVFTTQFPIKKFEWVVGELPSLDGTVKGCVSSTPSKGYLLFSSSKHKDAAWKVIKYFSSEDFLKGYLENGYALPSSTYMAKHMDASKTGRLADFALTSYESTYPSIPSVSVTGDDYRKVLWNAVIGQTDAETAIKDLNTRYNEALDRDIKNGKTKRIIIKNFNPLKPETGKIEYSTK